MPWASGFALVATFVAVACTVYSLCDIGAIGRRYGFYPFLMLMMAGVNGAFLTGDIFNLYVWFEVFLISSFGLMILGSEKQQIDGATKYAILNLVATTLFLIGDRLSLRRVRHAQHGRHRAQGRRSASDRAADDDRRRSTCSPSA